MCQKAVQPKQAFSLVEMTLIVIMIGITALFAIPRYEAQKEAPISSKAFHFLHRLQGAQNLYYRNNGKFADHVEAMGIQSSIPTEFVLRDLKSDDWESGWTAVLVRRSRWSAFGPYTVIFTEDGFQAEPSSLCRALVPKDKRWSDPPAAETDDE
jgi:type IV pilus assembly protein PilA